MIIVFDTSVWVSALHFESRNGLPISALELARNRHKIATCPEIETEMIRVLVEKFRWLIDAAQYRLAFFLAGSIHVPITGNLRVCRYPNDDMVLECAVEAGADVIVSGDKDLLVLDPYAGVRFRPRPSSSQWPASLYATTVSPVEAACSCAW